ncbi:hypothetical protein LINGRAHAP2_LOCUS27886 [Linum grandiflorum]
MHELGKKEASGTMNREGKCRTLHGSYGGGNDASWLTRSLRRWSTARVVRSFQDSVYDQKGNKDGEQTRLLLSKVAVGEVDDGLTATATKVVAIDMDEDEDEVIAFGTPCGSPLYYTSLPSMSLPGE